MNTARPFISTPPPLNPETKDIPTNCDLIETASDLADALKIGVFATRDIATGDEFWTVYSDIFTGNLNGRVLKQRRKKRSRLSKAEEEKKAEEEQDLVDLTKKRNEEKKEEEEKADPVPPSVSSSSSSSSSSSISEIVDPQWGPAWPDGGFEASELPEAPALAPAEAALAPVPVPAEPAALVPAPSSVVPNPNIAANAADEDMATDVSLKPSDQIASSSKKEQEQPAFVAPPIAADAPIAADVAEAATKAVCAATPAPSLRRAAGVSKRDPPRTLTP